MKYLFAFLIAGLFSCQDPYCSDQEDQNTGLVTRALDNNYVAMQDGVDLGQGGIRISTKEQYYRVFSKCCASTLDSIDFNQVELLGMSTVNKGSQSSYIRNVERNDANKSITYTITENYCQRGSPADGRGNFVIIPKQPIDYTIVYKRNQ